MRDGGIHLREQEARLRAPCRGLDEPMFSGRPLNLSSCGLLANFQALALGCIEDDFSSFFSPLFMTERPRDGGAFPGGSFLEEV